MRCRPNRARGRFAAFAAAVLALPCAAAADDGLAGAAGVLDGPAGHGESRLLVLPTVNGEPRAVALLLLDTAGRYYANAETLADWRIAPPYPAPVEIDGEAFHPLHALPGLEASVLERSLTATIIVPPALLTGTRRSLSQWSNPVEPEAAFGAYLDYDVSYTDDGVAEEHGVSSLLSPTLFTRRGSLSASMLYRGGTAATLQSHDAWVRLETAWTRDDPEKMRTLRVGDAVTPYGGWARSVRIGGIQIGTNFATQPQQVTFPQPSITGTAAVPSSLDVIVNGALRSRTEVPSGVFQIDDVPVVTGAGQIQVVTRDLLGREQVVTQDFYTSERLLKRGLSEYSLSAGALREDFGLASEEYGEPLVAGVLRRGLSDLLTIEGRFEGTADLQTAGVSLARAFGRYGVATAAFARSGGGASGTLWQLGHEYQGRAYRANIRLQGSRDFSQPGLDALGAFPELQVVASGGRNLGSKGSLGLSFVSERFADRNRDRRLLALSYSRSLRRNLLLSASTSYASAQGGDLAAAFTVTRVLGLRSSASAALSARPGDTSLRVDHRYDLPAGPGFGYRTSMVSGEHASGDAELAMNTAHARYSAELSRRDGGSGWRLQTRGSLAVLDGAVFAAREISDGFAVVDAGGFEGVRVYLENREVGTTDQRGRLLVPRLRPYEGNQLRLEPADLPLTARIDTPSMRIAPYYRSGTVARFGVEAGVSAILRAVTPGGAAVREGARARIGDGEFRFPVGIDGRLYVQDVRDRTVVEVAYGDEMRCTLTLEGIAPSADAVVDLGDVVCTPLGERSAPLRRREAP